MVKQLWHSHLFTYLNCFRWCTLGMPIAGSSRNHFISIFFKTFTLGWQQWAVCWMYILYVSDQTFAKIWWCILLFNSSQWDLGFIVLDCFSLEIFNHQRRRHAVLNVMDKANSSLAKFLTRLIQFLLKWGMGENRGYCRVLPTRSLHFTVSGIVPSQILPFFCDWNFTN